MGNGATKDNQNGQRGGELDDFDDENEDVESEAGANDEKSGANGNESQAGEPQGRPDFIQTQQDPSKMLTIQDEPNQPPIQSLPKPQVNGPKHDSKSNDNLMHLHDR